MSDQLEKIIADYKNVALSDQDVLNLVDGKANIIVYPDLNQYSSLDQILEPYGACFLLYEVKKNYGHWCCLFKTLDEQGPLIEFFDSYGGFPDSQREFIPYHFRMESGQAIPFLSYLMLESPYELSYNQYRFQKLKDNIKSCGRWCALRILLRNLPLERFKELFYNQYSDDLVTFLTTSL